MVVPPINVPDDTPTTKFPPEIQLTLDCAVQRQRHAMQTQITNFTTEKKQEFKSWREQAKKQARILARVAETLTTSSTSKSAASEAVLTTPSSPSPPTLQSSSDLFPKLSVTHHSLSGPSPLASASVTEGQPQPSPSPSTPPSKVTTLSPSLKFPGSSNYSKPVKRVMFQDLLDEEIAHSAGDTEVQDGEINVTPASDPSPIISVDGMT